MDIQEYIKSGVIESYVLGIADAQEAAELQRLRLVHPEIEDAIRECENWLLQSAERGAIPAQPEIKQKLFAELTTKQENAVVVPLENKTRTGIRIKYMVAASLILFTASAGINIYLYNKYRTVVADYTALEIKRKSVLVDNQIYQTKITEMYREMNLMSSPTIMKVSMPGISGKENNLVTVYWNTQTKDVYLIANSLPKAPEGKQYQLWALVDGKPVDAGMLNDCQSLCTLKPIQRAQAFAITLENAGGSPTPTMSQMYVMGNVKS